MLNTAIFDLDGTILDTLDDLTNSVNHALSSFGYPKRETAEVRSFVGNGMRRLMELSLPYGVSPERFEELFSAFHAHYAAHCRDLTKPYPGITKCITSLRASGIQTAVVSNKSDYGVQSLCGEFFPGFFEVIVGQRDNIRRKPWSDSVLEVMRALSADMRSTVYIGDSEVDIETAKNAGIPCISVDWGFRSQEQLLAAGAEIIVHNTGELLTVLLEYNA